jgi:hypothetical protein
VKQFVAAIISCNRFVGGGYFIIEIRIYGKPFWKLVDAGIIDG